MDNLQTRLLDYMKTFTFDSTWTIESLIQDFNKDTDSSNSKLTTQGVITKLVKSGDVVWTVKGKRGIPGVLALSDKHNPDVTITADSETSEVPVVEITETVESVGTVNTESFERGFELGFAKGHENGFRAGVEMGKKLNGSGAGENG